MFIYFYFSEVKHIICLLSTYNKEYVREEKTKKVLKFFCTILI